MMMMMIVMIGANILLNISDTVLRKKFFIVLSLELRASHMLGKHLSDAPRPFYFLAVFQIGSHFLPGASLGLRSSHLPLQNSWDCRYVPPCQTCSWDYAILTY
jgi:hypothetical protein